MRYAQYPPAPALAPFVRCVWTLEGHATDFDAPVQPILPDGCPELVLHFGDAFDRVYSTGRIERQPAILFAGQLTEQLSLRPCGRIAVLGVRFHPHGAAALLESPQHDFVGLTIDVDAVAPSLHASLHALCESIPALDDAAIAIQRHLMERLDPSRSDPQVRFAVAAICGQDGAVSNR